MVLYFVGKKKKKKQEENNVGTFEVYKQLEQNYSPISELIQPRDDHGFLNCTFQIQISFLHVPNSEYK